MLNYVYNALTTQGLPYQAWQQISDKASAVRRSRRASSDFVPSESID